MDVGFEFRPFPAGARNFTITQNKRCGKGKCNFSNTSAYERNLWWVRRRLKKKNERKKEKRTKKKEKKKKDGGTRLRERL